MPSWVCMIIKLKGIKPLVQRDLPKMIKEKWFKISLDAMFNLFDHIQCQYASVTAVIA